MRCRLRRQLLDLNAFSSLQRTTLCCLGRSPALVERFHRRPLAEAANTRVKSAIGM
jgi:hypothetical protein